MENKITIGVGFEDELIARNNLKRLALAMSTEYHFECFDAAGKLKWEERVPNIVVNEGLDDLLTQYFKGDAYTALWYISLIDNGGFSAIAAADTAASHAGWSESTAYSESVRESLILGSIASQSVDNSASKASFEITTTVTINGAFMVSSGVKGGSAGVLYGAASFASTRAMVAGDTLNITVTLTSATA